MGLEDELLGGVRVGAEAGGDDAGGGGDEFIPRDGDGGEVEFGGDRGVIEADEVGAGGVGLEGGAGDGLGEAVVGAEDAEGFAGQDAACGGLGALAVPRARVEDGGRGEDRPVAGDAGVGAGVSVGAGEDDGAARPDSSAEEFGGGAAAREIVDLYAIDETCAEARGWAVVEDEGEAALGQWAASCGIGLPEDGIGIVGERGRSDRPEFPMRDAGAVERGAERGMEARAETFGPEAARVEDEISDAGAGRIAGHVGARAVEAPEPSGADQLVEQSRGRLV